VVVVSAGFKFSNKSSRLAGGPQTASVTTDANGSATFTYTGANAGSDTVIASAGGSIVSSAVPITWIAAPPRLTTTSITARRRLRRLQHAGNAATSENKTARALYSESDCGKLPDRLVQVLERQQEKKVQQGGACHPKRHDMAKQSGER
jgi:hypothetical protein